MDIVTKRRPPRPRNNKKPPREPRPMPYPLIALPLVGAIPVPLYASGQGVPAARFVSIGILGIGAAFLVGALVGFLFAVPKRLQDPERTPETAYAANTNLEQISDWLTKILVGVSLTQIPGLVKGIQGAGSYLADGAGVTASAPFFSVLTLFYLLTGFSGSFAGDAAARSTKGRNQTCPHGAARCDPERLRLR